MNSMTGYGKCIVAEQGRQITIEMKSVNNRFLEINCRMPKTLSAYEDIVRKELQARLTRGAVDVFFNYENNAADGKRIRIDEALASEYVQAARRLAGDYGLKDNFQVAELLRTSDVVKVDPAPEDPDLTARLVRQCAAGAAEQLANMRRQEGDTIRADLQRLSDALAKYLSVVAGRASQVVAETAEKIRARVQEILGGVQIDEARLLNEVAFFADKADINEEISRLQSHLAQFNACLDADGAQGRKLDFLSQEINREINTMGSKSNDRQLTEAVLAMKNELEKIKEQIRNVE